MTLLLLAAWLPARSWRPAFRMLVLRSETGLKQRTGRGVVWEWEQCVSVTGEQRAVSVCVCLSVVRWIFGGWETCGRQSGERVAWIVTAWGPGKEDEKTLLFVSERKRPSGDNTNYLPNLASTGTKILLYADDTSIIVTSSNLENFETKLITYLGILIIGSKSTN